MMDATTHISGLKDDFEPFLYERKMSFCNKKS